jgi:LmbE family N-acetylglucosaminyl deacetylase
VKITDFLPIPDLEKCRSLLCIQPHPDDNEVGAGATIAKLARSGCKITYLTVTDGSKGTDDPKLRGERLAKIRRKEAEDAAALLGVHAHHFLEIEDGSYPDEKDLFARISSVIRKVKPELVMTVDPFLPYEVHPDHRKIGMAAAEACMAGSDGEDPDSTENPGGKPWKLEGIVFQSTAHPNTFINVDETWDLKIQAILAHKSQFGPEAFAMLNVYFDGKAREYAEGRGFVRAEAFKVLPLILLHMCVDTVNL